MSHSGCALVWHVQPRVVIFPCPTQYRPSSVKCQRVNSFVAFFLTSNRPTFLVTGLPSKCLVHVGMKMLQAIYYTSFVHLTYLALKLTSYFLHGRYLICYSFLLLVFHHSFTLGLNPSFSANPPYRSLSFFSFTIHYMDFPDCLLLLLSISVFLLFSFFLFLHFFTCRFRAVD